jgi:hypothetical protein
LQNSEHLLPPLVFLGADVSATFWHPTMKAMVPESEKQLRREQRSFYNEVFRIEISTLVRSS